MSSSLKFNKFIKIFFAHSPSRKDENLRKALESHLSVLKSDVTINWTKQQIKAENNWNNEIHKDINSADIIVLLISPDFVSLISNNFGWSTTVNQAEERHKQEEVVIIPVLLRSVHNWCKYLPFNDIEPLPKNRKPVKNWQVQDEAFVEVVQGIEERVNELKEYRQKLQEYEQHFSEAIQREYPLTNYACDYLNNLKQTWSLKDKDTAPIEEQITRQKQKEYQQKLQQYSTEVVREIQREYPLRVQVRERLKYLQQSLNLKDKDVQQITRQKIEEYITRLKEDKQQKKLHQQQSRGAFLVGTIVTIFISVLFMGHLGSSPKMSAEDFFRQGYSKFDRSDYRGAVEDYTQAISTDSNYSDAYLERGNAYYSLKDYQAAIKDYTQVIRLAPNAAEAYYNRGVAYSDLGDKRRAVEDYQKAGDIYQQQGQTAKYQNTLDELKKLQQ